jgi:hypothetical protein
MGWTGLEEDFSFSIAGLARNEFLVMQALVGLDPNPYAQVAREADGYYCEVVSGHHLPAARWPLDELAFVVAGWAPPVGRCTNWSTSADSPDHVARLLVGALRYGRCCSDPSVYVGTIGQWDDGPADGEDFVTSVIPPDCSDQPLLRARPAA